MDCFLEFSVDFRGDFDCQKDEFSGGFQWMLLLLLCYAEDILLLALLTFYHSVVFTSVTLVWNSVCLDEDFGEFPSV